MKIDTLEYWDPVDLFDKMGLQFEVVDSTEVIDDELIDQVRLQVGEEAFDYLEEDLMYEREISCYRVNNRLYIHAPSLEDLNLIVF